MAGKLDPEALEGLLPQIPAILVIIAPDGTVLGGSTGAAEAAGVPIETLFEGHSILEIAPGNGAAILENVAGIVATGKNIDDVHVPWISGDGVTELYRHTYFPIVGADDTITSVGLAVEEVGEREKVRSRMRLFESVIDQATDFVAVAALDRRTLYLNPAGRALVGHGLDDPLLERSSDYVAEGSSEQFLKVTESSSTAPWRGSLQLEHVVTGESIPVDAMMFTVRDDKTSTPLFQASVMRDTREYDRLLRRLELHVERMPVALITVGPSGQVKGWNPAAERLFGVPGAAALGGVVHELLNAPRLGEIVAVGAGSEEVVTVTTPSGQEITVEWSAVILDEVAEEAGDIMLIGRDMTEQLRAEQERGEALRAAAMATWSTDRDGGDMQWSDELYGLVGVDRQTFIPTLRSCWGLLERGERARARRLRRRMMSSPQFRFSFRIVRPGDGITRFLEVEGRRSENDSRLIGTARDVTIQRRAVDRLRELDVQRGELLERMLLSEEEERGRIARALHDDTVQLMAALQLNLDRIQSVLGGTPKAATTLVSETRAALSDALERTRHLMFELRPQQFDRHGLRTAIAALCEQVDLEAGFTTSLEIPDKRFGGVIEELCYRTVREAMVNARKHSGASHVWVRLEPKDGSIVGSVGDNGRGFDPGTLGSSQFRLHMGLEAMAERIRLAGGRSDVVSAPGQGCTVSFTIPIRSEAGVWDGVG